MEPETLKRGKAFHSRVQEEWKKTAEGTIVPEHTITLSDLKKKGKSGRLDIFVGELGGYISVVEIKSTDWDRIKPKNIQKNLTSHRRQVWKYIEKYLDIEKVDVCPGIIYPRVPDTPGLKSRIENYLNEYGLQVVWYFD